MKDIDLICGVFSFQKESFPDAVPIYLKASVCRRVDGLDLRVYELAVKKRREFLR